MNYTEADLRTAWEEGFKLCQGYGDNSFHFRGEQKEKQWQQFLNTKIRIYGVQFSGHGSEYLPENPKFDKTLEQAQKEALEWELRADTIGGCSQVVTKEGIDWIAERTRK